MTTLWRRPGVAARVVSHLERWWYTCHPSRWFLWPLALIYRVIVALRRQYLQRFRQQQWSIPVIVVGNLTVGGVGKTPLVIALVEQLQARGLRVGIVSRGYGAARGTHCPHEVRLDDAAMQVGDEPLLLARKTGCPVVIAPQRAAAVQYLLDKYQSQVVVSDDGLQHYAMGRTIEIVVVDGLRGFGNGMCLPAGPLREPVSRLRQVDFVVVNGEDISDNLAQASHPIPTYRMDFIPGEITQLTSGQSMPVAHLSRPVAAVAAIGHPSRFFALLHTLGISFNAYPFTDHHSFQQADLCLPEKMLVMTEKDAVKCHTFATDAMYFLPVNAKICDRFWEALWSHKQLQGYA